MAPRPQSPCSSPRAKLRKGGGAVPQSPRRLVVVVVSAALRRRGLLLLVPLMYLVAMVVFMGCWDLEFVPVRVGVAILRRSPPGAVYKSPQVFKKLWPFMQADVNHSNALATAWHSKASQRWKSCFSKKLHKKELPPSNGFLIIEANGGLNQQRLSICDAVAVAGMLNATLVIPMFHLNSVWRDSSKFGDIFDEEYFIDTLKSHVRVVKELPEDILQRFDNNISNIINMRAKALSTKSYYLQKVLPKLLELGAVRIAPFSNRLAHSVPPSIQALRCLANYEALQFSEPIRGLAKDMVDRMLKKSSNTSGKYISVHLRFEEDMVAFSCCTYDGGKEEKREMDNARERSWRGKFRRPGRVINPEANRMDGKCPLTPLEVGMMLRGMGFGNNTPIYVASGKIYNAEKYMAPLRQMFPLLETKETLASADELAQFKGYSSRLAALDYTVCAHSEAFVTTQGGNFPHFLLGHRRYLYAGHSKTIQPDKRKLVLALDNPNIRWDRFKRSMQEMLRRSDLKGVGQRKSNASIYTFPMPDCMCQQQSET
ncbi:O-fucosyltransferase 9-like [Dioscorea cayenensis subsp. rotundata]|uniref:O-fucosyltransferase family protein n=1 Tax=Dioscorea cayennensis subsp. rotundata TaxID=55577 RepID=A0AB40BFX9_DIOCR|nr:O-fucosyltransferase 9-like [Dioscorea cayenensis subsp. rotundata]